MCHTRIKQNHLLAMGQESSILMDLPALKKPAYKRYFLSKNGICVGLYKCSLSPFSNCFSSSSISTLALSLSFSIASVVSFIFSPTRCLSSLSFKSLPTIYCTCHIPLYRRCDFPLTISLVSQCGLIL